METQFLDCPECGHEVTSIPSEFDKDEDDQVWFDGDTGECECGACVVVHAGDGYAYLRTVTP
jgi:hypothetical protein